MKTLQLTARTVNSATERGYYGDGSGLYLQISKYGTRSWVFRYTLHGRRREMGIGPINTLSLKEARERARAARQLLLDGIDPIEARKQRRDAARAAAAKHIAFEQAASQYIAAHEQGWRNERHRREWRSSLAAHAFPVLGKLSVDAIELPHILKVLEPMWSTKTETANRVRGRIERILAWATVRGYRKGENPARWGGHLKELLASRPKLQPVKHMPALPFNELPAFMAELRKRSGLVARALEFCILTAARTGEITGARWDEISLKDKVWTVPAVRTKSGKSHRVPLTNRTLEIIDHIDNRGECIFGVDPTAMLKLLRRMRGDGITVHGFRSSFSDWARERTAYPRDVIELALAHALKDKTEAAYRRGDAIEKRRRLMEEWARYCSSPAQVSAEVTPIGGAA
jgi:integrase